MSIVPANRNAANAADAAIGARVRERRTGIGMSLDALGTRLGVTYQQVQKYEKGTNRIGASRLQDIADALEVPVAYFFERRDGDDPAAVRTSDEIDLLAAYGNLPPLLKRRVLELVTSMADAPERAAA